MKYPIFTFLAFSGIGLSQLPIPQFEIEQINLRNITAFEIHPLVVLDPKKRVAEKLPQLLEITFKVDIPKPYIIAANKALAFPVTARDCQQNLIQGYFGRVKDDSYSFAFTRDKHDSALYIDTRVPFYLAKGTHDTISQPFSFSKGADFNCEGTRFVISGIQKMSGGEYRVQIEFQDFEDFCDLEFLTPDRKIIEKSHKPYLFNKLDNTSNIRCITYTFNDIPDALMAKLILWRGLIKIEIPMKFKVSFSGIQFDKPSPTIKPVAK